MRIFLKKYFITMTAVYLLTQLIPVLVVSGGWQEFFYSSFILSILLYIAQPIINLVMLPINLLTLNLTSWILNIAILYAWILFSDTTSITSWEFAGAKLGPLTFSAQYFPRWQVIVLAGVLLTIIIQFIKWLVK